MARKLNNLKLLPLFIVTVVLVFSVVFTVLLIPIFSVSKNIGSDLIFMTLLVVTATVSSAVSLIFYLFLKGGKLI